MAIVWFIRKGTIFRIVLTSLQRRREEGGLELIDIEAKYRAIFLTKMREQGARDRTLTAAWLQRWNLRKPGGNPPNILRIHRTLKYLRIYALEWAYLEPKTQDGTPRHFKRRVYRALRNMAKMTTPLRDVRVTQIQPKHLWGNVWNNLHSIPKSEVLKSAWYTMIHDLLPTNTRVYRIRLLETEDCTMCGEKDTTFHRLTECGAGEEIWECTRIRLAAIHRTDRRRILPGWLLAPSSLFWPRQRHLATLWILANLVYYLTQNRRTLSLEEDIDFLRRARCKTY